MDILIGVGGTGAKIVEAVVQLATIGIGPSELRVGFVDQDKSNGNLNRAQTVLGNYIDAREAWRGTGGSHKLGNAVDGTYDIPVFHTDIRTIGGDDGLWVPNQKQNSTLSSIFGAMQEDKYLFDALFETGDVEKDEEQDMPLDEGYRGRPHIGAAAISMGAVGVSDFWDEITETIKSVGSGAKVNIMIAGSVFGGTGAAGFPTLARIIRDRLREEKITANVHIGGILMLPYFGYPDPDDDQNQNVARANEQLMQSRGALRHYQKMLSSQHIFDQLYLIGWSPFFVMDYHRPGAGDQRNPALLPEMFAARAIARFFEQPHSGDDKAVQQIMVSARDSETKIGWPDIPAASDAENKKFYKQVGQFLRFAAAFKYWKSHLDDESSRKAVRKQPWYKMQGLGALDWQNESPSAPLKLLDTCIDDVIRWCAMMETYVRKASGSSFNLWHVGDMTEAIDLEHPNRDPDVHYSLSDALYSRTFDGMVSRHGASDAAMPDAANLADGLTDSYFEGHKGVGGFIAALYYFSSVQMSDQTD